MQPSSLFPKLLHHLKQKLSPGSSNSPFLPLPLSLVTELHFLSLLIYLVYIFHVSEIIQYLSFCVWFISFSMFSRFIHVSETSFFWCMYIPHFICWLIYLGCFHLLAIVNTIYIAVQVSVWVPVFISFEYIPGSGTAGPYGNSMLNFLRKHHFTWSPAMHEVPVSPYSHQHFLFFFFFKNYTHRYKVVFHCGFICIS